MGHKVSPVGFRIGVHRDWNSRWFSKDKNFSTFLLEDVEIRKYLTKECDKKTIVSHVEIERKKNDDGSYHVTVAVFVNEPGPLVRNDNIVINELKKNVEKIMSRHSYKEIKGYKCNKDYLKIVAVKNADLDATIVAKKIARDLENRANFRNVQKKALIDTLRAGAKGIKTLVGGRLNGAEIARNEGYNKGTTPLHTLRSDIDFAVAEAHTTYGRLGVKVWICRGNYKTKEELAEEAKKEAENYEHHNHDRFRKPFINNKNANGGK